VPLHQPLPSTPLTHEAKALKDTRVLPLIHCICTAETHRLDSCSLLRLFEATLPPFSSGRPLLPPLHSLLHSQPSHSSSALRISNHWKPIESPLATAFPRQRLLRARRPRTRRVDGRASTPVDAAMRGCWRARSLHTEANYCLTELIYFAELAPVSATTRHGTIATRRDLPPPHSPFSRSTTTLHRRRPNSDSFFHLHSPTGLTSHCVFDLLTVLPVSTIDLSYYGPLRAASLTRSPCRT
jgi:hypothetical protein